MATSPRINLHPPGTTLVLLTLLFAPLVAIQLSPVAAIVPVAAAAMMWMWTEFVVARERERSAMRGARYAQVVRETRHQAAIAWVVVSAVSLWLMLVL